MGQAYSSMSTMILGFPGSLCDKGLLSDPSLGRTSRKVSAPAVKDVILMAQGYILRVREILPEFWLALAKGVDYCWEMAIWFDKIDPSL